METKLRLLRWLYLAKEMSQYLKQLCHQSLEHLSLSVIETFARISIINIKMQEIAFRSVKFEDSSCASLGFVQYNPLERSVLLYRAANIYVQNFSS